MVMKKRSLIFLLVFLLTFTLTAIASPLREILSLENGFLAGYDDIQTVNENKTFGDFFKAELNEKEKIVGGQKIRQGEIVFKLFGFIPVRRVQVSLVGDEDFYVGGVPIGLSICADGAIVVSDDGESGLREGDIITQINGQKIEDLNDVEQMLKTGEEEAEVKFLRKNKELKTLIKTLTRVNS